MKTFKKMIRNHLAIFTPEDGGFVVTVPGIQGCHTQGDSIEEAEKNAEEVIQLCVSVLQEKKEQLDRSWIHHCLSLATRGRGKTGINPMVGAVLVRGDKFIAEGWHEGFGKPHAERQLVQNKELKIRSDDVLYVSLEPCCHTNKKTLPCAQMIVEGGIKTVVYGMQDPNPYVSGKGIQLLRSSGVKVIGPVLPADCARLNRGYISLQTKQRPWVTLKSAQTTDGRFSRLDATPLKITSDEQDRWSHEFLRARHDAILVGVGTVISDDPQLTVRYPLSSSETSKTCVTPLPRGEGHGVREPYRLILDPHLRIPLLSKIVSDSDSDRTILVVGSTRDRDKTDQLQKRGVRIFEISYVDGHFDWSSLWKVLTTPVGDFHGISSILVEGGPKTWEVFRRASMVDEEVSLIGQEII